METSDSKLLSRFASAGSKSFAVSGSSGLIGSAFADFVKAAGHRVRRLVRSHTAIIGTDIAWDPSSGFIEAEKLREIDCVVHLAGESIAAGRWTSLRKVRIRDSRVLGTKLIANTLASLNSKHQVLVSASAIGYYGDCGTSWCSETSARGAGFLPEVCEAWEQAADPARQAGLRVVTPRIGIVLSPNGGALQKMLPAFRLGLGGPLGSGSQYMSWIELGDLIRMLYFIAMNSESQGAYNAVAPGPVTNGEFSQALGAMLNRPSFMRVPAVLLRLLLGEFADEALLGSCRVQSEKIMRLGFDFQNSEIQSALRYSLSLVRR